ncbi:MAG: MSCRAMM family protein [Terriglobales bacterium]
MNSVTHEPIAGAQVYSPDNRFAVMTDDQGHFEVALPQRKEEGTVTFHREQLIARKPGFLTDRNNPALKRVSTDSTELTISLVPEAILTGKVTLAGSDSPDGAHVQLFRKEVRDGLAHWAPQDIATTNSRGEYRFAELYPGDYRVGTHEVADPEAFLPGGNMSGYPPVYFPSASDFPGATTIHLAPGNIFQANFSLARRKYYPVKISVSNASPSLMGINVNVSVRGDGAPGYSLGYNLADHSVRGMLPNGIYVVEATTFSQQGATGLINLRIANGPAEDSQLTLLPNGIIPVQVREEFTSTPPPTGGADRDRMNRQFRRRYLNVILDPVSDFGRGRGAGLRPPTGPNDESLAIDNVQPGRYRVQVNSSRGYAASVTSGGLDLLHEPLVVGPGGSSSPIEITMRDDTASFDGTIEGVGGAIEGQNSLPGQTPSLVSSAPSAYIYCIPLPDSPGQFTQAWASPDGEFRSPPIPPGEYRILAFKHQQNDLEYRNPEAMRAYESKGQVVRLVGGQKEHLQLQLVSKANDDGN